MLSIFLSGFQSLQNAFWIVTAEYYQQSTKNLFPCNSSFALFDRPEVMEESIVAGNGRNEASEEIGYYQIRK